MRKRKKNKQVKMVILGVICLLMVMAIGYAAFSTNLNLKAKGNVLKPSLDFSKVIKLNTILNYKDTYTNGNEFAINEDEGIVFDGTNDSISNLVVPILNGDYTNGFTVGLDFDITLNTEEGTPNYQCLMMVRATSLDGFFLFTTPNILAFDIGGSSHRTEITNFQNGHYVFIVSYGNAINGYILVNKDTKAVIVKATNPDLPTLNNGISAANYELQIGADLRGSYNGNLYQTNSNSKFYSYYFNNVSMTDQEIRNLLIEFDLGDVAKTIDLSPIGGNAA